MPDPVDPRATVDERADGDADATRRPLFRAAALAHHRQATTYGEVVEASPPWSRWMLTAIIAATAAVAAFGALVRVDETLSRTALVVPTAGDPDGHLSVVCPLTRAERDQLAPAMRATVVARPPAVDPRARLEVTVHGLVPVDAATRARLPVLLPDASSAPRTFYRLDLAPRADRSAPPLGPMVDLHVIVGRPRLSAWLTTR